MNSLPWHLPKHKNILRCIGTLKNGRFGIKTSRGIQMKRYGDLYEKIYDMENLRLAHKNARKDKLFYREVKMVDSNEEYYLTKIHKLLKSKSYDVGNYTISIINDKGKERELCKLPYFPDRIIQWAILLQTEFIFMKVMTNFTCASLKYRGIHKASKLLDDYMKDRPGTQYCLKIDVNKFYPSINHIILKQLLRKKFKDSDLLELFYKIIDSTPGNKGIPIGSYLSQFFANFYLSYFDHWLKEVIGCQYVIRYMDDVVILHHSKDFLHWLKRKMDEYLIGELDLLIKHNWQVFPTGIRGVDYVGYRNFFGFKLLRKSTCKKYKKQMLKIKAKMIGKKPLTYAEWCSANSYNGWVNWCDGYRLSQKYFVPIEEYLTSYYITEIKERKVS